MSENQSETSEALAPEFPQPPFPDAVRPVTGNSFQEWANNLFGTQGWPSQSEGNYNVTGQYVESVPDVVYQGVIVGGPPQAVNCVSYVAVGGDEAGTVDVAVYPLVNGVQNYQGWDGSGWSDGPAINSSGYYWYRMAVQWEPPFQDNILEMFAKTYRGHNPQSTFKLWAFTGIEE